MIVVLLTLALAGSTLADFGPPLGLRSVPVVPVLSRTEVRDDHGQFSLSYTTGDGQARSEHGALKPTADGTDYVLVQQGTVAYTSPEGIPITYSYIADENGFRPEGKHIPPPALVPEAATFRRH